jgi:outer membrane protein OmpA-like peptidoglycan-associated protein
MCVMRRLSFVSPLAPSLPETAPAGHRVRRVLPVLSLAVGCAAALPPAPPPVSVIPVPPAEAAPVRSAPAPEEPPLPDDGLATLTAREIQLADRLHFVTNSAELRPESLPLLDSAAAVLIARPRVTLEIGCHTDNRGSPAHGLRLSQDRADAVRAYLIGRGVAPGRLVAKGYGPTRPIADGPIALQRRCELVRTDGSPVR